MKKFSYFVILQKQSPVQRTGSDPFDAYRIFVQESIRTKAVEFQLVKTETIQKNGSILRGGLTQFLSTPLQSDKKEIIKLIEDSIENTVTQLDAAPVLSSVQHSLWKVMEPQQVPLQRQMVGVMKRLLKNGRSMLVSAGCVFGKNSGDAAVSLFEFDGFSTVSSLHSILAAFPVEEQLLPVNGEFLSAAHSIGTDIAQEKNLVVIDFNANDAAMTALLTERFQVLTQQFGIQHITLSTQSLHSSVGAFNQLRVGMDVNKVPLGSVLVSLTEENPGLEDSITNHGSVTVLERMP
jgi:hypothetical protein